MRDVAKPLLNIVCHHEPYCKYPTAVRITMGDGSVHTYVLENKMDYQFRNVMDSLSKMTSGYQYRRKRRCRTHSCDL